MTGELGHTQQHHYELWDTFAEQAIRRFGPSHGEEKALQELLKVRYKSASTQFLGEFEYWNVKAKVTGIAYRKLIRDQIPDEAVAQISIHQEYADDGDWIEARRQAALDEEDFHEAKRRNDDNFSGSNTIGKRKRDEPTMAKTTKKFKCTSKE